MICNMIIYCLSHYLLNTTSYNAVNNVTLCVYNYISVRYNVIIWICVGVTPPAA